VLKADAAAESLLRQGAIFAYVFGSVAQGTDDSASDLDVAAWFPEPAPQAYDVDVPFGVDLLVLNSAPLELAGRVALHGVLLLEADETARVRWEAMTRKIYLDERYRIDRSHRDFLESLTHG
jgi:uncharacterized protein